MMRKPWETSAPAAATSASSGSRIVTSPSTNATSGTGLSNASTIAASSTRNISTASTNVDPYPATSNGRVNSTYGSAGYGSTYGGGYSSGYGGYGGYGSGYGGGMGYGSSYGGGMGYGSSYGGYGGGMGYGGGGGMGGPMMDPNGQFGWLASFNQTVGSIGQITQVHENDDSKYYHINNFSPYALALGDERRSFKLLLL